MTLPSDCANDTILTRSIQWDSSLPRLLNHDENSRLLSFIEERFGICQTVFEKYWILAYSRQAFLFKKQQSCQFSWPSSHFIRAGLPFIRNVAGYLKPTTVFAQRFGKLASKNVITLDMPQIKELCQQGKITIFDETSLQQGYVIVKTANYPLGICLFLKNDLLCRFPKAIKTAMSDY